MADRRFSRCEFDDAVESETFGRASPAHRASWYTIVDGLELLAS
jgi:hypothetical protein